MLEGLWDWLGDGRNAGLLFVSIVLVSSLSMLLIRDQVTVAEVEAAEVLELQKKLMLSITCPYINGNVTFQPVAFSVTNEQNYTVQLRTKISSDPAVLMGYAVFSSSVEDGTVLGVDETLQLVLNVSTFANPENVTGEYYLKVYGDPL